MDASDPLCSIFFLQFSAFSIVNFKQLLVFKMEIGFVAWPFLVTWEW